MRTGPHLGGGPVFKGRPRPCRSSPRGRTSATASVRGGISSPPGMPDGARLAGSRRASFVWRVGRPPSARRRRASRQVICPTCRHESWHPSCPELKGAGTDNRSMDRLVDLDVVAAELARCRPEWVRRGLAVGEFTWRDAAAPWPQPIVTDRAAVAEPESLGVVFREAGGGEAELVLWCGGWADLNVLMGDEIVTEAPEFADAAGCVAVAESLAGRLLQPGSPGRAGS